MQDELGNVIGDGDWIALTPAGLVRGQVVWVSEGNISITSNGEKSPAFLNVMIQIAPDAISGKLKNVSKIYGPPRPAAEAEPEQAEATHA